MQCDVDVDLSHTVSEQIQCLIRLFKLSFDDEDLDEVTMGTFKGSMFPLHQTFSEILSLSHISSPFRFYVFVP